MQDQNRRPADSAEKGKRVINAEAVSGLTSIINGAIVLLCSFGLFEHLLPTVWKYFSVENLI